MISLLAGALCCLTQPVASIAADPAKPASLPFALYPVVSKDTPDAEPFLYTHPTHSKPVSGYFRSAAVVSLADVLAIRRETREIATAPFTGIAITLTPTGKQKLAEYMKAVKPSDLVVALDGEVYHTLNWLDLQYLTKEQGSLFVIFPDPYATTTNHLARLLEEKLVSELAKQQNAE